VETRVHPRPVGIEVCGRQRDTGTGSSQSSSVFPFNIILPILHKSSSACCSYQKDKRAKPGDLAGSSVLS
jgi:hypothetical protein